MVSRSEVTALIDKVLAAPDETDERWDRIRELQCQGTREVFDACLDLIESEDPERREVGVDIVVQLGVSREVKRGDHGEYRLWNHPFPGETADALLDLLAREKSPQVLDSIAAAFGHLQDERAVEPLSGLRSHPDEDVRMSVVFGLLGHDDDTAIEALTELSTDEDSDVRDWATFGLGSQIDRDTPQLRETLAARLGDSDRDTHDEAVLGLARRGDKRAIEPLLASIDEGWEGPNIDESLAEIGSRSKDPRLTPYLARFWEQTEREPDFDPKRNIVHELMLRAAILHGLTDRPAVAGLDAALRGDSQQDD